MNDPIKFDIIETSADTIEARRSDGEILLGMTRREYEKRIRQTTKFREALESQHLDKNNANYGLLFDTFVKDYIRKIHKNPFVVEYKDKLYLMEKGRITVQRRSNLLPLN
jgi:hypothetical protein